MPPKKPHESQKGRGLTAAQRRRMLQERKMRALKMRLYASLGVLAVLLVVLIFAISAMKRGSAPVHAPLLLEPEITATPTPTAEPTPSPTVVEITATPVPTVTATIPPVSDEAIDHAPAAYDPTAPFSYASAYAAAVLGTDTGALIVPDYSRVDPAKRDRWPAVDAGFMPMVARANTQEKIIAVTVDDCFQAENLHQIVQCALDNGAQLTIFPIGQNLEREGVAKEIRAAWAAGMEIENHTYSHAGTYHYDDAGMADDIWRQSYLLNQVLGVNYRQHFFRPKGGDERFDQRTHAYVNQMGFAAIALWTQSGSVDSMDSLLDNLAPGNIYLFHTTDNDLNKLRQFIPAAVQRGYRLVTLNEMFGLPVNETADLSTASAQCPPLQSFHVQPMTLKSTAYARAAAVVQARLIELGWMKGEPTGVYGKTTRACMELFQTAAGITVDGTAGTESQRILFSADAPVGGDARIRELAPGLDDSAQAAISEMLAEYP